MLSAAAIRVAGSWRVTSRRTARRSLEHVCGHRALSSGAGAAPGFGAFGIPEVVPGGAPPHAGGDIAGPSNLRDTAAELRRVAAENVDDRGQPDITALQPLVDRSLTLAEEASLEDFAELAKACVDLRLRNTLKDSMHIVSNRLSSAGPEALPTALLLVSCFGRAQLYVSEAFDFCSAHLATMQPSELALFVYEAGRHGLRSRHYGDQAVHRCIELVPQFSLEELLQVWQGYIRLSRDRKDFYIAARPRVEEAIKELSTPQVLLALRGARDLNHVDGFIGLHAAASMELLMRMDTLTLDQQANCLMQCTYSPRYRAQAQGLVRSVEQRWNAAPDLSALRPVEVVDSLETFASWGMKPMQLVARLDQMLCDNKAELQFSGNVSLWVNAVIALSKLEYRNAKWPLDAMDLAQDKNFVERVSFFQQSSLAVTLGRLRLFDEVAFGNIADLLASDHRLFKSVRDMAPVLWGFVVNNYYHEQLFDNAYDLLLEWLDQEVIDASQPANQAFLMQAAWSFAAAGYHKRYESYAAVLDYAFFGEVDMRRPPNLRRTVQLADLVCVEAPDAVNNCQYADKIRSVRLDERSRKLVTSDPPGDSRLHQDVLAACQQLGWPVQPRVAIEDGAVCADISLEPKFGRKVALLMAGDFETLRVPKGGPMRESGNMTYKRRLLEGRGWKTAVVDRDTWSQLSSLQEQAAFLERASQ